jgi:diguanylate cyclase (GGDEF)-like protein
MDLKETQATGLHGLVRAVQTLALVRDCTSVRAVARAAAREITGADHATFVTTRDACSCLTTAADVHLGHRPDRFEERCLGGWAIATRGAIVVEDLGTEPRIRRRFEGRAQSATYGDLTGSAVVVPVRTIDPVGALGVTWCQPRPIPSDVVDLLQTLANTVAVTLDNIDLYLELEDRVARRTAALERANAELEALTVIDHLTGLHNRRGFATFVNQELKILERSGRPGVLLYLDLDGLKAVNDRGGHEAGDRQLIAVAEGIKGTIRSADVAARIGGDEFAVFLSDARTIAPAVLARLREAVAEAGRPDAAPRVSIGLASFDPIAPSDLDTLLADADRAMYLDKRSRRRDPLRRDRAS